MEKKKPKIVYFLRRDPTEYDQLTGGTWSNLLMLRGLENVEVVVVTNHSDILTDELSRLGIRHVVLDAELSYSGVGRNPMTLANVLAGAILFNARFFQLVRKEGAAIVQCDENSAAFVALGAKLGRSALVVAYRNFPGITPTFRTFYKFPTLIADKIVATAEVLHKAVVTEGFRQAAKRTELIYNGVDLDEVQQRRAGIDRARTRAEFGITPGEVAIGVVASIVAIKQQAEFLEEVVSGLAPELEKNNGRVYLIGGWKDNAYPMRCKKIIESLQLHRVVKMVGYVRDMTPWYVALDMSVYPGIEGTARALIESSAHELPIVARSGCSEAVVHGTTGLLCPTIAEMGPLVMKLTCNEALRREMGANGKAFVEDRFNVSKNRHRYEALYAALAQNRGE